MISPEECKCAFCKNDHEVDIPKHLIDELLKENIVVFAGAGISTENRDSAGDTFYDVVSHEMGGAQDVSFPALMERYCSQPDGRIHLVKKIKERFDYFSSFDDFCYTMNRFHKAISPLYMIKNIITTNWDDFFEKVCGLDAFVNDSDMPFWESSERRVMKIHGSIRNFGSIVATEQDYQKSFRRLNNGPMGAQLKSLITQKTIIYTGYSLSDDNYIRLARAIAKMTQPHTKHAYFLAPKIDKPKISNFPIRLIPIETDGSFFFEQLRLHLDDTGVIVPETAFEACHDILPSVIDAHDSSADAFLKTHHPLLIFTMSYQDGLIHGLKRIEKLRMTGYYHDPHRVTHLIGGYVNRSKEFRRRRDFWNSSYGDGYCDALLYLISRHSGAGLACPPMYGFHGSKDFYSLSSLLRFPKRNVMPTYRRQADRIFASMSSNKYSYIPEHTPYL
ncbi:MAG: SIR2 family protein [Methylocystis sp.]